MNNKMSKKQFWIRFSLYCLFGGILPFLFLVWRFELFNKVSKLSIGGWGLIAIIFISVFIIKLIGNLKKLLEPYPAQIFDGLSKVIIPLIIAAFCIYYMQDIMTEIFQFICVLIFCELIAIVNNPFPQWLHQHGVEKNEDRFKTLLTTLGIKKEGK